MAKTDGLGDNLYIEGSDLSGDVGAISAISSRKETVDVTGISSSAIERVGTRADGNITFNSWFNPTALAAHPVLAALPTTDVEVLYTRGTTRGNPCAALTAKQVSYDMVEGTDRSLSATIDCQGTHSSATAPAGIEWGTLVTAGKDTHAANGTSSTGIVETQSTKGGVGFQQIFSIASGSVTTNLIEDSADTINGTDGSWGTLLTFAGNAAVAAERKTVTGTIEKGLRATSTGTFTGFVFAMGFRRGTASDMTDLS